LQRANENAVSLSRFSQKLRKKKKSINRVPACLPESGSGRQGMKPHNQKTLMPYGQAIIHGILFY